MNSKKKFWLFVGFLIFSLFIVALLSYFGLGTIPIWAFFSTNHFLSAIIYSSLFTILASFSFSVSAMTSLGVLFFPWYEVVIYAMIGVMGSSIVDFYISRKLGRDYVRNYLEKRGGKIEKFDEIVEKDTFKTTLILSAIFFVPPTISNFLGGIIKINLKDYSVATFLGNIPNTFFTVTLVYGLFYSNSLLAYISGAGLVATTLVALYFYTGEIRGILKLSFPWMFKGR